MSKAKDTGVAKTFAEVLHCELDEIEKSRQRRQPSTAVVNSETEDASARASKNYLVGLAFSGGGIRSATLNLGILQGLAQYKLLPRIDYLSTVSGGSYIGSWFTRWVWREGLDKVSEQLSEDYATSGAKEPEAITFLRQYSNYLTPLTGIFSADTWTLILTYIRNVFLNLLTLMLVFIAIFAVLKLVPWVYAWIGEYPMGRTVAIWWCCIFGALSLAMIFAQIARSAPNPYVERQHESDDAARSPGGLFKLFRRIGDGSGLPLQLQLVVPILLAAIGLTLVIATADGLDLLVGGGGLYVLQDSLQNGFSWTPSPWLALLNQHQSQVLWGVPIVVALAVLGIVLCIGLMGRQLDSAQREWWSWLCGLLSIYALAWIGLFSIAFGSTKFIGYLQDPKMMSWGWMEGWVDKTLVLSWILTTVGGLLAGKSASTNGEHPNRWLELLGAVAPPVFMVGFLILVSFVTDWISQEIGSLSQDNPYGTGPVTGPALLWCLVGSSAAALLFAWRVDVNEFSMHNFYRNRLSRCYQGASNRRRAPDRATGFDNREDPYTMAQFRVDNLACFQNANVSEEDLHPDAKPGPYHLVNTTLNLVGGEHLGWQKRKGTSFIFSPLYSGYNNDFPGQKQERKQLKRERQAVGLEPVPSSESDRRPGAAYRPTGAPLASASNPPSFADGITMGTAVAISGAAASPNMGYHSSKPLAFLMTLFNVRLGWWLANPALEKWSRRTAAFSLPYLFTELFGKTTDRRKYLYLSDGGHFENLGIYELVRRRCCYIIACDAEADGNYTFGGLGNAIEKCRTDFGVEIEIDVGAICLARNEELGARYCAVGKINYGPKEQPGFLLYLKSALIGQEPTDVRRYKSENPDFPHQTTGDQFFDETQFESYRMLGQHIVRQVFEAVSDQSDIRRMPTEEIFVRLRRHWHPPLQAVEGRFTSLVHEYNRLMEALQQEPKLAFLDGQLNIGFAALTQEQCGGEAPGFWLPEKSGPLRAGFYFCMQLIVLMETVYHDLQLEINHNHPDTQGWMNVFRHWSWSAMVQATWSITANTYGTRFQDFCKRRLNLKIGEVRVPKEINTFFPTFNIQHSVSNALRDVEGRLKLNMVERRIVSQLAREIDTVTFWVRVYPVQLVIHSPSQQEDAKVTVGFGLVLEESKQIVYLRIQSHLRHMGLGRRAIRAFIKNGICSVSHLAVTNSISSRNCQDPSEANVTTEDIRRFQWLFESVKRTIPKADHDITSSETGAVLTESAENALTS